MEIHPAFMAAHGFCQWSEDEEGNCGHKIEPVGFVEPNDLAQATRPAPQNNESKIN